MLLSFYPNINFEQMVPTITIFAMMGLAAIFLGITCGCFINDFISAGYLANFILGVLIYGSGEKNYSKYNIFTINLNLL